MKQAAQYMKWNAQKLAAQAKDHEGVIEKAADEMNFIDAYIGNKVALRDGSDAKKKLGAEGSTLPDRLADELHILNKNRMVPLETSIGGEDVEPRGTFYEHLLKEEFVRAVCKEGDDVVATSPTSGEMERAKVDRVFPTSVSITFSDGELKGQTYSRELHTVFPVIDGVERKGESCKTR